MNREPRTMQVADAATASRAPKNTPAMVKKIGKTTYKVHVHFSNTSTETMSDKIKRIRCCCVLPYSKQAVLQNPSSAAIKRLRAMLTRSGKEDHAERKIFDNLCRSTVAV